MVVVLAIGAFQAFFFGVILLSKNASWVNRLLAFWLFLISLHLLINYFEGTGLYEQIPQFIGISSSFFFLYGPFLYYYVKEFTGGSRKYFWLHLSPFIIYNLLLFNFYALDDYQQKMSLISSNQAYVFALSTFKFTILVIYLLLSLFTIIRYEKRIRNLYSNATKGDLNWMKFLIYSIAILLAFVLLSRLFASNPVHSFNFEIVSFVGVAFWIFSLGYYGLKKAPVFNQLNTEPKRAKYAKTRITEDQASQFADRLIKSIEEDKPFLHPDLNLETLAKSLDIPSHQLSQVINDKFHQNFYEFINTYRLKEMEMKMMEPENRNLTLLGIAQNAGFGSKASFNRTFKHLTGTTPSKYFAK